MLAPSPGDSSAAAPDELGRLIDEFKVADFRAAERLLDAFARQGRTVSGYPRVRPSDCAAVTKAIRRAFESSRPLWQTGDVETIRRFDALIEAYGRTDLKLYPGELFRAQMIQAEARLLLGDFSGARVITAHFADRPYALEGGFPEIAALMRLDCQARAGGGEVEGLASLTLRRVVALSRLKPLKSRQLAGAFAPYLGLGAPPGAGLGMLAATALWSARRALRARRGAGNAMGRLIARYAGRAFTTLAGLAVFLLRYGDFPFGRRAAPAARPRDIVVTRAMGGIGDLLMLTPGLRALATRKKIRIKLAIDRKYFAIFANNPHVELIDIHGPALDVAQFRAWRNLTLCPAAAHESRKRPFVKKGRVELFARAIGAGRRGLAATGWGVELALDERQLAFRRAFIAAAGFGGRALVGVQPYSRDSYKDHPRIGAFVRALAARYDVLLFHHLADGLPTGEGIASTAGLQLADSLALVSALDAMLCVDSAFLHAAAAFDVPSFALFGPTDGKLFTRGQPRAMVLAPEIGFACSPCWRNEDIACQVTGQTGPSPCIDAISPASAVAALAKALASRQA